jgi:transketolase
MRERLISVITESAAANPNLVFITGDLGFSVVEPLQAALGERFINAGVAEANMISMASTMSLCGLEAYVYSIAPFVTSRCYEQIRNDVCYHNANVRIIGIGAGFSYGTLGPTHHALEDATIMATLPQMTVFSPASLAELRRCFELGQKIDGPIYFRLGRENGPEMSDVDFEHKTGVVVHSGGQAVNFVTSGSLSQPAFEAAFRLVALGIDVRLITVPVLAPFPSDALADALASAPVVTAFEGYTGNPLEVGVMQVLCSGRSSQPALFLNAGRQFAQQVGSTDFQRERVGLSCGALVDRIKEFLKIETGLGKTINLRTGRSAKKAADADPLETDLP